MDDSGAPRRLLDVEGTEESLTLPDLTFGIFRSREY